jgi:hypothetical protein
MAACAGGRSHAREAALGGPGGRMVGRAWGLRSMAGGCGMRAMGVQSAIESEQIWSKKLQPSL